MHVCSIYDHHHQIVLLLQAPVVATHIHGQQVHETKMYIYVYKNTPAKMIFPGYLLSRDTAVQEPINLPA